MRGNFYKNRKGFTLVELLVVIAIIGILSAVTVVNLNEAKKGARDGQRLADLNAIRVALDLYYDDNGTYPVTGFEVPPAITPYWSSWNATWLNLETALQPYLSPIPRDPINNNFWTYNNSNFSYMYNFGSEDGYTLLASFETDHNLSNWRQGYIWFFPDPAPASCKAPWSWSQKLYVIDSRCN